MRLLLSKTDQTEQGEVGIQTKQSAIHWKCDNEEREKEIEFNGQDGAINTCIRSAEIIRANEVLL